MPNCCLFPNSWRRVSFAPKQRGLRKAGSILNGKNIGRQRLIQLPMLSWEICLILMFTKGRHTFVICVELLEHPTFKSNLVVGLACFDYSVLFTLPRGQTMDCFARLFQRFCVRGCLAKELKNVHIDDFLEIIDDLWFVYSDELHIGPKIEDIATFLSSSQNCPLKNLRQ